MAFIGVLCDVLAVLSGLSQRSINGLRSFFHFILGSMEYGIQEHSIEWLCRL